MPEPTITVTLSREEAEVLLPGDSPPGNKVADDLRLTKSALTKLQAALASPQPERYTREQIAERLLSDLRAMLRAAYSAALPDQQPVGGKGECCKRCGSQNAIWSASSPLWNAVIRGGSINGDPIWDDMVCATCFMQLAEGEGIASGFRVTADQVNVELETVTPSGRVWDEGRQLWVDQQPEQEGEAGDWPGEQFYDEAADLEAERDEWCDKAYERTGWGRKEKARADHAEAALAQHPTGLSEGEQNKLLGQIVGVLADALIDHGERPEQADLGAYANRILRNIASADQQGRD